MSEQPTKEPLFEPYFCSRNVSDHTGFYWHKCGKPAKFITTSVNGTKFYRCGIHARSDRRMTSEAVQSVEPIK